MSDARERWKEQHRRRRVRARRLDPLKRITSNLLLVAAVVCVPLALLVAPAFFAGFAVALIAGLLLRGLGLGEIFSGGEGIDASVGVSGDGGDSGS